MRTAGAEGPALDPAPRVPTPLGAIETMERWCQGCCGETYLALVELAFDQVALDDHRVESRRPALRHCECGAGL
jgi:hypothetical protein